MKDSLGYIKEELLNFYNENNNSQEDLFIDENNIIDVKAIEDKSEYNQSSQQTLNEEDFDYTLLKIIVFLIFL